MMAHCGSDACGSSSRRARSIPGAWRHVRFGTPSARLHDAAARSSLKTVGNSDRRRVPQPARRCGVLPVITSWCARNMTRRLLRRHKRERFARPLGVDDEPKRIHLRVDLRERGERPRAAAQKRDAVWIPEESSSAMRNASAGSPCCSSQSAARLNESSLRTPSSSSANAHSARVKVSTPSPFACQYPACSA